MGDKHHVFDVVHDGEHFRVFAVSLNNDLTPVVGELTAAELSVLLVLCDASPQSIAEKRGRSIKTIRNQINSIYRKYGVNSHAELIAVMTG